MSPGDRLDAIRLFDLGETAAEAGIGLEPAENVAALMRSFIERYYGLGLGGPALAQRRLDEILRLPCAKKNALVATVRSEIVFVFVPPRMEARLMGAFLREGVVSGRSYKRKFRKKGWPQGAWACGFPGFHMRKQWTGYAE